MEPDKAVKEDVILRAVPVQYPEHESSPGCWCEPEVVYADPATGNVVYVHRSVQ